MSTWLTRLTGLFPPFRSFAPAAAPSLTITRSAATITTTDPVGTVSVGAETVLTYSLENTGTADTSNLIASLTGATGEATVTTAPSDIAAGDSGSFAITLETDAAASIEFTVTLSDDSGTLAEWTVTASVVVPATHRIIRFTAPSLIGPRFSAPALTGPLFTSPSLN